METPGNPLMLVGALVVVFMILTSGRREDQQAAWGWVTFHVKAVVIVVGLILFVNWLR